MSQPHTTLPPLNMPMDLTFAPEDGQTYYLEDVDPVFAQQPLQGPSLPDCLMPSRSSTLKPPTLLYGWRLGHDKLMKIALDHFPEVVRYSDAPALLGLVDEETHDWTEEDWEGEHANVAETIFDYDFIVAIREYLGIGPEGDDLFNIDVLYDSQRQAEYGLTVGSNYLKVIDKDALQKLEDLIAPDVPAMWYLHCNKWMWRRVVPKPKNKAKSKSATQTFKLVATASQTHNTVTPLDMSPELLFAPEDGQTYSPEDKDRVFAQQPLEGPSLPDCLIPSQSSALKPPTLVYGWRLGHEKLMQLAVDHFPQVVCYRDAPALLGLVDEETHDWTEEDWENEHANVAETIFDYDFIVAIREFLGIGPEGDDLFNVDVLYDSQGNAEYGLTVGSNYLKVIDKDAVEKLEALIAPDVPAVWYLHCNKWMWRRVAPKPKDKCKSKTKPATGASKPVATAPQLDTTVAPLDMSTEFLFAPEDGQTYYLEDISPVFAQQPLKETSLPEYLIPSRSSTLKPPTLVYGWRLGYEKLMQIALEHFPHVVRYRNAPALFGLVDEETLDLTDEREHANVADTIWSYGFIVAIREHLGIGPEDDNLFSIDLLYDSQGQSKYGLTVGSNYLKVIEKDALEKLAALIASPDEPPMWYLHRKKWMWRRVVPKTKRKTKTKITKTKTKTKTTTKTEAEAETKSAVGKSKAVVTLNESEVTPPVA